MHASAPTIFNPQPTLVDALVVLRPLTADDFTALAAVASDPLIWEQHPARNRYEPEVFAAFFAEAMASGGALLIIDQATGAVIGSSRYFGANTQASEVEIGWSFLARSHWGGPYNQAVKRLMLRHALATFESVLFLIGPNNVRSQRAVEKIGGHRVRMQGGDARGERVVYRLARADFDAGLGLAAALHPASES